MEPEKKEMTVEELKKFSDVMRQVPHYSIFRFGMLLWLFISFAMIVILCIFVTIDWHDLKELRQNFQKATGIINVLQTRIGTLEMDISELKAAASVLRQAQDLEDSRAENVFSPDNQLKSFLGSFIHSGVPHARHISDFEIQTLSCVGPADNPLCVDLFGKSVSLTDRQKIMYARKLKNLLKKHSEKPLK
ncbi:MAG: hypothetical protein V1928_02735 [Parcubacteria group bacterium]